MNACDKHWAAMTEPEQRSITLLGWTAASWDAGDERPMQAIWDDFTAAQLAAAELVGFTSKNFAIGSQPQVSFGGDVLINAQREGRNSKLLAAFDQSSKGYLDGSGAT